MMNVVTLSVVAYRGQYVSSKNYCYSRKNCKLQKKAFSILTHKDNRKLHNDRCCDYHNINSYGTMTLIRMTLMKMAKLTIECHI